MTATGTTTAAARRDNGPVIALRAMTVRLGATTALDRVDRVVPAGRIVAVVGPNGAGKTTLLDVIAGDVAADGSVDAPPPRRIARAFQGSPLPETLTVGELFDLVTGAPDRTEELAGQFGLAAHL